MNKNIPKVKDFSPQIQAQPIQRRINKKKVKPRHIKIRQPKIKDQQESLMNIRRNDTSEKQQEQTDYSPETV